MRPPIIRASLDEITVDLFAGGGGASTGIERAGLRVDVAINHSPEAIAVHAANHPSAEHYQSNVWEVDPEVACRGRVVGLLWLSPDCTFFSRAKGGKPRSKRVRSLAWVAIRWARAVRPRVICLENVPEFEEWGPLDADNMPDPARAGLTFRVFVGKLRALGYHVEWRPLVAADYGAPTTRRRLFLVARCDGQPIAWPEPTHGRGRSPWVPASEIIDWSLPCPSIFARERPLAEATMRRIAEGVRRYVIETPRPFIVDGRAALITKHYGGVVGHSVAQTLGTVTAQDHHALTVATLSRQGVLPLADRREAVRAFLLGYYSNGGSQQASLFNPLPTITGTARFGLVLVHGEPYAITDIGMRMLSPRELFNAQGFPADYVIAPEHEGSPLTKTAQIRLAGNSVCPPVAAAIVGAQFHGRERAVA